MTLSFTRRFQPLIGWQRVVIRMQLFLHCTARRTKTIDVLLPERGYAWFEPGHLRAPGLRRTTFPFSRLSAGVAQGDARHGRRARNEGAGPPRQGRPFVTATGAMPERGESGRIAARPGCRGGLLFGYFFLATQEKVTRRRGATCSPSQGKCCGVHEPECHRLSRIQAQKPGMIPPLPTAAHKPTGQSAWWSPEVETLSPCA